MKQNVSRFFKKFLDISEKTITFGAKYLYGNEAGNKTLYYIEHTQCSYVLQ